jgi:uncharacterized membrane protein
LTPTARGADINSAVGYILRYGVTLSALVLALGLAVFVLHPRAGPSDSLQGVLSSGLGLPTLSPGSLVSGMEGGSATSILELGTLILVATPIFRVAVSVLIFIRAGDRLYSAVTLLVLLMLLAAVFLLGPAEA